MPAVSAPLAVFAVDFVHGYGSERYTLQLVNALAAQGRAVDLILQDKGTTLINDVDPRVRQIEIGTRNPFSTVLFLARYLKTSPPRALITVMEKPSLLGIVASVLARYKNIVPTIHFDIDTYAQNEYALRRNVLRLLVALFYRYAPVAVGVSDGASEKLQHWVGPRTKVVTILNGFDLSFLRNRSREKVSFPWLTHKTVPVVIGCSRFVPLKGFDVLLKAFARVKATSPARLILLGDGKQRPALEALVKDLGIENDVAMPGYVSNPQAWFAASDVFVFSSRSEGFGNVLVEALASGVRVISTDCLSGPRQILDSGKYGTLIPVDDVPALASALLGALRSPSDEMQRGAAQQYLDARFSLEFMAVSYLSLVDSLPR